MTTRNLPLFAYIQKHLIGITSFADRKKQQIGSLQECLSSSPPISLGITLYRVKPANNAADRYTGDLEIGFLELLETKN